MIDFAGRHNSRQCLMELGDDACWTWRRHIAVRDLLGATLRRAGTDMEAIGADEEGREG